MDTRIYLPKNNIFTSTAGLGKYNILGLINPCIHLNKNHQLYNMYFVHKYAFRYHDSELLLQKRLRDNKWFSNMQLWPNNKKNILIQCAKSYMQHYFYIRITIFIFCYDKHCSTKYRQNGYRVMVRVMVFNATFNNISVISWWSVLLVEETGVPGENHRPAAITDKRYHIMLYRVHLAWTL